MILQVILYFVKNEDLLKPEENLITPNNPNDTKKNVNEGNPPIENLKPPTTPLMYYGEVKKQ